MRSSPADNDAALRLAEATRRLLRASRIARADDATMTETADALDVLSARLESGEVAKTLWITGLDSFDDFELGTDLRRMFPYSPATGVLNAVAPDIDLELTDDEVRGTVTFAEIHNGPPFGFVHGGVISMVFDELLAAAAIAAHQGGYTGRLSVSYRKVTPVLTPIELHARVAEWNGRKFTVHGSMRLDGEVLSEGEALFIEPRAVADGHAWDQHGPAPSVEPRATR